MTRLFKQGKSRQDTMMAFNLSYMPEIQLSLNEQGKIVFKYSKPGTTKKWLTEYMTEDETALFLPSLSGAPFKIHWAYNNIPTEEEWKKMQNASWFRVEYRISPLIPGGGRIALIIPQKVFYDKP